MSISAPINLATAVSQSLAVNSTLDITLSVDVPAGSLIFLFLAFTLQDLFAPDYSDSAGNSYHVGPASQLADNTGGSALASGFGLYTYNSLALSSGGFLRVRNAGSATGSIAMSAFYVTGALTTSDPF